MTVTTPANTSRPATTREEAAKPGSGERLGDLVLPIGAAAAVVGGVAVAGGLALGRTRD